MCDIIECLFIDRCIIRMTPHQLGFLIDMFIIKMTLMDTI